jgi:glycosyltransferase involved in cell wall biosynthesis
MSASGPSDLDELRSLVAASPIRSVRIVAWRDLDDPEAGGSELHAHKVASCWAASGLSVTLRTSQVPNAPELVERDGYRVVRRGGRYGVFPQAALEGLRHPRREDALVEVWNGMPFFSPIWRRKPRITAIHHVHGEMWRMVLGRALARIGDTIERILAPWFYRRSTIVTLSESSKEEIHERLHLPTSHIAVVPVGIDPRYRPGGAKRPNPHVVAVGRLVPVKRYELLIRELANVKCSIPELTAEIIGEGYERAALEQLIEELGATAWLRLPGRASDDELLDAYRSAWVVASSSLREGWGMTLTEAAACGTPSVATDIAGHRDAVRRDVSGLLVPDEPGALADGLVRVLADVELRARLSEGALAYASTLTWEATATEVFRLLAASAPAR